MATPKGQAAIELQRRFAENAILLRDQAGLSQAMTAEAPACTSPRSA